MIPVNAWMHLESFGVAQIVFLFYIVFFFCLWACISFPFQFSVLFY
jgi:hypothetical protein